jgi:hypothetical protein
MERTTHAPAVFDDGHGSEVDIWSVGQLILDSASEVLRLSQKLRLIGEAMKAVTITRAQDALGAIKSLMA